MHESLHLRSQSELRASFKQVIQTSIFRTDGCSEGDPVVALASHRRRPPLLPESD